MMEKDQLNYCKIILEELNISVEEFKNYTDNQILDISNLFSTAQVLDKQSGVSKGNGHWSKTKVSGYGEFGGGKSEYFGVGEKDHEVGGCSKILHKCDYEQIDFDLFIYQPKVSIKERNAGCDELEDKTFYQANNDHGDLGSFYVKKAGGEIGDTQTRKNNHPTLKPIALNEKILRLFKTPNNQKICYPFAGAGSEIIGGIKAGFDNWSACELNQDYIDIANARIEYWTKQKNMVNDIKLTSKVNEVVEKGQVNLFDILSEQPKPKQESLF